MIKDLVSIITPCYNTSKYLPKLLTSIVNQTFPNIEMFVIDDGSTDDTQAVIKSFIPLFKNKGYHLEYIYQENKGQSFAIQRGLELIKGEYFVWPDSDDYYDSNDAISKMVNRFKNSSSEIGIVRSQFKIIDEAGNIITYKGSDAKELEERTLFEDCILLKNDFYFCSGAYMIKTEYLKKCTKLPVYAAQGAGQNWQLLLPVLYHYRCSTILEPLYNVVERFDSHSRKTKPYLKQKYTAEINKETIIKTLDNIISISDKDLNLYKSKTINFYYRIILHLALKNNKNNDIEESYKWLKKNNGLQKKDIKFYKLYKYRILKFYLFYKSELYKLKIQFNEIL